VVTGRRARTRFAVYLIPPYQVALAVAEIHRMLRKQFGFLAAGQFPVHATIKGFFKKTPGGLETLIQRLDEALATQRPFPVHFCGLRRDKLGISLDISCLGEGPNPEMVAMRNRVLGAVGPFIAPDCDFSGEDADQPFAAHITLAFRDIPTAMQDEVLDYLQDAPLPSDPFIADTFHFLQFHSQDWQGDWPQSLSWRLLRTWRV
jgi:2'-5' RNA ligase